MYQEPLSKKVYDFTKSVIKHRRRLISIKKSSINPAKAESLMDKLNRNLRKNAKREWAVGFMKMFGDDIKYLIKYDDFEKHNKFNELSMLSKL